MTLFKFKLYILSLLYIILSTDGYTQVEDDLYGSHKEDKYLAGIIVNQTDTLKCFILEKESYYSGVIKYKLNLEDKKSLKAKRINVSHLQLEGLNPYDRIYIEDQNFLMQRLVDGDLRLYQYIVAEGGTPGMNASGGISVSPFYDRKTYYMVKRNIVYKMSRFTFRDELEKIFAGNEKYISLSKELKYGDFIKDIEKIISEFNEDSKH